MFSLADVGEENLKYICYSFLYTPFSLFSCFICSNNIKRVGRAREFVRKNIKLFLLKHFWSMPYEYLQL